MSKLALHGVTKSLKGVADPLLKDINLFMVGKEFLVIDGAAGCGKTTLLRMIAGLEDVTSGEIYIDGQAMKKRASKKNVAMVFTRPALYVPMTARQNILYGMRQEKLSVSEKEKRLYWVSEGLEITRLLEQKPKQMTLEEQQRIALAKALAKKPQVLLLDDPFREFGEFGRIQMIKALKSFYQQMDSVFVYATRRENTAKEIATQTYHL